ncbi:MAG: TIGR03943 family protein [Ardenticatenaceae bacterium]|nr:TIGR03943 family protein [Ardenticatenaceae bacterium]
MNRLLKTTLFLATGIFLYTRITNGTIRFYINERFVTLTLLAAVGMMVVGASYWLRPFPPHNHDHDHHDHDHHDHDHHHLTWLGLLIVALPLILGWFVPPQPLGAGAIGNREIGIGTLASVAAPGGNENMGLVAGEKNILDWLNEFQHQDTATFVGQEAHVIGFVYRDERFAEDTFMIGRFVLSCCVADAAPVGLVVQTAAAPQFPADQWVDITGHFITGTFDGITMPILVADTVEATETPQQPYLYR